MVWTSNFLRGTAKDTLHLRAYNQHPTTDLQCLNNLKNMIWRIISSVCFLSSSIVETMVRADIGGKTGCKTNKGSITIT
jgi:hypothetical protein